MFVLIFILLVVLLLFYYIDLESNIIILLGVTVILLVHNIIVNKEHFNIDNRISSSEAKLDTLIAIAKAFAQRSSSSTSENGQSEEYPSIDILGSCPQAPLSNSQGSDSNITEVGNVLGGQVGIEDSGRNVLGPLTSDQLGDLYNRINRTSDSD